LHFTIFSMASTRSPGTPHVEDDASFYFEDTPLPWPFVAAHGLQPQALTRALDEHPAAVAAYVVTPSYFGAVADVRGLAEVAHARGTLLVVDEAWGAHFGFHDPHPEVEDGAKGGVQVVSLERRPDPQDRCRRFSYRIDFRQHRARAHSGNGVVRRG
jgi:hypothetical protein